MHKLTIYGGNDKYGNPEGIQRLDLFRGELYTIVGNTGSGKSRLQRGCAGRRGGEKILLSGIAAGSDLLGIRNGAWLSTRKRAEH